MEKFIKNSLILIDGSYYFYRSYYSFINMTNNLKEPVGAIYGILNIIKNILIKYNPSHLAIVFDFKGKSFRNSLFKNYKLNRPSMPKELCCQIKPLYNIIKETRLHLISIEGVEADDVIGTLSLEISKNNKNVLIVTNDKDMAQLVSPNIALMNIFSNTILGVEEIKIKFGVPPYLIADYLALIGDRSDNIPGVPRIGKKTAQILLSKLGGLQKIYQRIDEIKNLNFRGSRIAANNLNKYHDIAFLSYQLAMIKTNVKLDLNFNLLKITKIKIKKLIFLFQYYEKFKNRLNNLKYRNK